MLKNKPFSIYTTAIGVCGIIVCLVTLLSLETYSFSWQFPLFALFTMSVASRMTLNISHINVFLTFSDSMIFLAFISFGGKEAIIVSGLEMLATCYVLRRRNGFISGQAYFFNVGSAFITTALCYGVFKIVFHFRQTPLDYNSTQDLVAALGVLAIAQFAFNSVFLAAFHALRHRTSFSEAWSRGGLTVSITQIIGTALAGLLYKIWSVENFFASFIILIVFSLLYLSYRKIMRDMNLSIDNAHQAQIEKAESERLRAEQAEQSARELGRSLAKQEIIGEKLQKSYEQLKRAAYFDSLTELPNRACLIERLNPLFESNNSVSKKSYVLFIDLKQFKNINNHLGRASGDKILVLVAKRLSKLVNAEDTVARVGGGDFAVALSETESPQAALEKARFIHKNLTRPFSLYGSQIFLNARIGVSPFDEDHKTPDDILRDADIALHRAKEKNQDVQLFDRDLRMHVLETVSLENALRFALEKNEISAHYQPLVSLQTGEISGFEALMRWNSAERGFISPAQFIPIAETSGLIIPLTEWLYKETTAQLAKWQKISPQYENLMLSLNLSARHILDDNLVSFVKDLVKQSGVAPSLLKLEITESAAMEETEQTLKVLSELKKIGVCLSMDDFGTGYSSLNYLHNLPFDTLKIDRSFVLNVGDNGENSEILQTVISLARHLRMKIVAEGIETESQLRLLRNLGCDFGQGFLMAKPMPAEQIETLLYQKRLWFPETFLEKEFGDYSSGFASSESSPVSAII